MFSGCAASFQWIPIWCLVHGELELEHIVLGNGIRGSMWSFGLVCLFLWTRRYDFFLLFFLLVPFCEFAYEAMGECLESIFWKNVLFYRKLLPLNVKSVWRASLWSKPEEELITGCWQTLGPLILKSLWVAVLVGSQRTHVGCLGWLRHLCSTSPLSYQSSKYKDLNCCPVHQLKEVWCKITWWEFSFLFRL